MSEDLRSLLEETIFDYFEGSMPAHLASGVADLVLAMPTIEELRAENERLKAELDELKAEHDVAFDRALAKTREAHDLRAAVGGLSPEATRWAIRIARAICEWNDYRDPPPAGLAEWRSLESARLNMLRVIEACPPEMRAQITGGGNG